MLRHSFGVPSRREGPPSIWDTHGISENRIPVQDQRCQSGPSAKISVIPSDGVLLRHDHCTSTPHRSETDGIAERAVRRVKEGTSAVLLQSGLNESWWTDSLKCHTYLRNVTDLSDGKTPYERRFGQPFKGPIIPFGSLV